MLRKFGSPIKPLFGHVGITLMLLCSGATPARALALPGSTQMQTADTAIQVVAGEKHTCLLTQAGNVWCWGSNQFWQLGFFQTDHPDRATPVKMNITGVAAIAAGSLHTCALHTDGSVACWGYNLYGQAGEAMGDRDGNLSQPSAINGLSGKALAITAGTYHSCALLQTGKVQCWGSNVFGQLGSGEYADSRTPVDVAGLSGAAAVEANGLETCALTATGGAMCWGSNYRGALGNGSDQPQSVLPVEVKGLNSGVAAIAVGNSHVCAITNNNGLKCWGENLAGQLGDGTNSDRSTPVDVVGLTSGVKAIRAGKHTCAVLLKDGAIKCWGNNTNGRLGDGSTADRNAPVNVTGLGSGVVNITVGGGHVCALLEGGTVKCWGSNYASQLGDGIPPDKTTPSDVIGLGGVTALAAAARHTCARLVEGSLKCWGANIYGELGNASTLAQNLPSDVIGLTSGVMSVAVGSSTSCVVITGGGVRCWGNNSYGQLGNGIVAQAQIPGDVIGLSSGVSALGMGGLHVCAVMNSGGVKCWGGNNSGQLGDGTTVPTRTAPVDVSGLSAGVAALALGNDHTCALTNSGGVKCWGANTFGQLGDGTTSNRNTPAFVLGLSTGVVEIAAGAQHTCARTGIGAVKCWGRNNSGELGDDTATNQPVPVLVSGLNSGATAIAAGGQHTCAVVNGSAKCWGYNRYGERGDGTLETVFVPTLVTGLSNNVKALSAGESHTCALMNTGAVKCWGLNNGGQLGDGSAWRKTPRSVVGFSPPPLPPPSGDPFEDDDACERAGFITAGSAEYQHTFHRADDQDWIKVEVATGTRYVLSVSGFTNTVLPLLTSYLACTSAPAAPPQPTFSDISLPINSDGALSGTVYIQITNFLSLTFSTPAAYTVSFRATGQNSPAAPENTGYGAAIIVAGRNNANLYQNIITQTTDHAYNVLLRNGFTKDRILYLDNQIGRDADHNGQPDDIDMPATPENLRDGILNWARAKVGTDRALWVFMADHGNPDKFLVDGDGSIVTPALLSSWLSQLENTPGVHVGQINVVLDACFSGSFIKPAPDGLSKLGRAILTSTSANRAAYGSQYAPGTVQRMNFSEALWSALDGGYNLWEAFDTAREVANDLSDKNGQPSQLDANGDGTPNTQADRDQTASRGLFGKVTAGGRPSLKWTAANTDSGLLTITARGIPGLDEAGASSVSIFIVRPDVVPKSDSGEINLSQHDVVPLTYVGQGQWTGTYIGFDKAGTYTMFVRGWNTTGSASVAVKRVVQVTTPHPRWRNWLPILRK